MILLPGVEQDGAVVAAEKIREAIAGISVVGVDRKIAASVGVAVLPADGADVDDSHPQRGSRALHRQGARAQPGRAVHAEGRHRRGRSA